MRPLSVGFAALAAEPPAVSKGHIALLIISILLFCWLFISVAATVYGPFGSLFRNISVSYRDWAEERRRVREAKKWGTHE